MIKQKSVGLCVLFTLLTCGIYGLYWFVCITDDVNRIAGVNDTSGGMALVFTLLTCGIYGWYWAYKLGDKLDIIDRNMGRNAQNNNILMIILMAIGLGFIVYMIAQGKINDMVAMNSGNGN